jgi:hypothetical protein
MNFCIYSLQVLAVRTSGCTFLRVKAQQRLETGGHSLLERGKNMPETPVLKKMVSFSRIHKGRNLLTVCVPSSSSYSNATRRRAQSLWGVRKMNHAREASLPCYRQRP